MIFSTIMNLAINLYHQFLFMTKKIRDEKSLLAQIIKEKRILAIEFKTLKSSISHCFPENRFGICLLLPQLSAKLLGDFAQSRITGKAHDTALLLGGS